MNFIRNSIKYTLEGSVKLKFKRVGLNEIKISVSDTCIGMKAN